MIKIPFDDKVNQKGDGQGYRTGTVPTFYKKNQLPALFKIPVLYGTVYTTNTVAFLNRKPKMYLHWFASITTYDAFRQLN
jgi:hypothetical protein